MNMLNIYKALQIPKFKRSMERTEKDREKYNRYMRVRASYYYLHRNAEYAKNLLETANQRRIKYFRFVWKCHLLKNNRLVESMPSSDEDDDVDEDLGDILTRQDVNNSFMLADTERSNRMADTETFNSSAGPFIPIMASTQH